MNILIAAILLQATPAQDEVAAASKKAVEMTSYAFKASGSDGSKRAPPPVEGRYEKDQAVSLKAGGVEAFRKGGVIVYKEGEAWKRFERQKGENKAKKGQDPAAAVSGVRLPHEELEAFEKRFESVTKVEARENDCSVYSGPLTPSAAALFGSTGRKGKAELKYAGTARLWVDAGGRIVKYEIDLKATGEQKGKAIERSIRRRIELTEVGTAKVELPEAAKKALGGES